MPWKMFANFALRKGNYDLAFSLKRGSINNDRPRAFAGFAEVYVNRKSYDDAIDSANIALMADRTYADGYHWLGIARAAKGDSAESKKRLQQATALGYASPFAQVPDED